MITEVRWTEVCCKLIANSDITGSAWSVQRSISEAGACVRTVSEYPGTLRAVSTMSFCAIRLRLGGAVTSSDQQYPRLAYSASSLLNLPLLVWPESHRHLSANALGKLNALLRLAQVFPSLTYRHAALPTSFLTTPTTATTSTKTSRSCHTPSKCSYHNPQPSSTSSQGNSESHPA